jgi:TRAP-type C4-dicarboxylate transport system permease small subunit
MPLLFLIFFLLVNTWVSYLISNKIYNTLKQKGVRYAVVYEVLIFFFCFTIFSYLAAIFAMHNIHFVR